MCRYSLSTMGRPVHRFPNASFESMKGNSNMTRSKWNPCGLRILALAFLALAVPLLGADMASAQEGAGGGAGIGGLHENDPKFFIAWGLAFVASLAALTQAFFFYKKMMSADEGSPKMVEIAGYVREGANAYLTQQYKVVAMFFVVIFALLAFAAFGLHVQSRWVPFAFITGGFFSGLAGWFGMKTATWASSRTAAGAQKSLNQGLQVAFRSGAVMGLTVVGLGLIDITIWFAVLKWVAGLGLVEITVTMLCFGMGASAQALFARVGGGIFTKAADVGADLVGKVEQGIPEDDARNPATIADNVGDNVGDVAGMGADLYESYCGSILATAALGVAAFHSGSIISDKFRGQMPKASEIQHFQTAALFLPIAIAAVGIFLSILGIYLVRTEDKASQSALLKALARGINASTFLVAAAAFGLTYWLLPQFWTISFSVVIGLFAGWLIGKWTEYSTSDEYKPTQQLADQALTGPATVIIGGVADGMKSVWVPVVVVAIATLSAFACAIGDMSKLQEVEYFALGLYGVGIAAVGMLSTLGITLATDAYGPIADNAGGNAQMAELEPQVRERTDALDSLGNTTAATGKGFAIGSAALTALALLAAYVEEVRVGFDRWGDQVAAKVTEEGYYKLSGGFLIDVHEHEGEKEAHKYFTMPASRRDTDVKHDWAAVDISQGPAKVPAELAKKLDLVDVDTATMPDFMTYYDATLMNPKVLIGVFIGAMAVFVFCAMTMKAVGRAAKGMVEEVRRQFRENPGIMLGTSKPDYARPVAISTKAAQKEMILPSLLGLILPIATGLLLGVGGVMGLLVGTLTCGFCVAIFMANAGGSWDNAKKYIEAGAHGGKYLKNAKGEYVDSSGNVVQSPEHAKNPAHAAAVIGDTVGDPFKDTSGPSLNILIKLMSMVSVVAAGLVVRYSLLALGIF
jgi:inorganic pyrophosphatase/K(+)-stimulated pyrophosphate-energized sodium pump